MAPKPMPIKRNNRHDRAGLVYRAFTLVEILVVLVLLGFAAALVIPNMTDTSDLQAKSAARMVQEDLQYAQDLAVTTQVNVKVIFDSQAKSYRVTEDDNESTPLEHPIKKSAYIVDFSLEKGLERVENLDVQFGTSNEIKFMPIGSADKGGSVTVRAGSVSYIVQVAPATGRITVVPGQ